jgi:CDP-diacylglycerol---glycerol-3-phosphate 3-phosphatidyltransferase
MWCQSGIRTSCCAIPLRHQTCQRTSLQQYTPIFSIRSSHIFSKSHYIAQSRMSCQSASSSEPDEAESASRGIWTVPTMLTLLRVVAIPALVASWFASQWIWCFWLFVGASITDFFDGYLARAWNCSTPFGAFLDPVADKLMVATILILIGTVPVPYGVFAGNAWLLPAIACIIIAREITMSALREWGATLGPEAHSAVAVNALGKYKTSSQMVSLVLLLGAKTGYLGNQQVSLCTDAGIALLFVATFLTVSSVLSYFKGLWKFMV